MDLDEKLNGAYLEGARVFIIKLRHVSFIDITSLEIIETFIKMALRDGKRVILSGVRPEMTDSLEKAPVPALAGGRPVRRLLGILKRMLEEPFLLKKG